MKLGYHISIAKGLTQTSKNIINQKMTAVQIFPGSPKNYFPGTKFTSTDYKAMLELNIPKFVHSNYFINLANDTAVIPKSIEENLKFCDKIGATGLVIHMGSNKSIEQGMSLTLMNIQEAYSRFAISEGGRPNTRILIETTAEGGNRIRWSKILELVDKYGVQLNLGIVIDTCHLYSAGYTANQIVGMIEKYHGLIDLIHLNNPSPNVEIGKHKDQHDIPLFDLTGKFSKMEIENFLSVAKLYDIPSICETGDDENGFKLIIENYQNF